jgi:hypothetical protein
VHDGADRQVQGLQIEVAAVLGGGDDLTGRAADPPRDLVLVEARVPGLEPQDLILGDRARGRVLHVHLARVAQPGDAGDHVLEPDLVEVEAQPAHHRVLRRAVDAARPVVAAVPQADLAARQRLLAQPAEPLVLRADHLLGAGHDRVVEARVAAGLVAGVARAQHVALEVRVLVGEGAERMAQLVQRDQRALR